MNTSTTTSTATASTAASSAADYACLTDVNPGFMCQTLSGFVGMCCTNGTCDPAFTCQGASSSSSFDQTSTIIMLCLLSSLVVVYYIVAVYRVQLIRWHQQHLAPITVSGIEMPHWVGTGVAIVHVDGETLYEPHVMRSVITGVPLSSSSSSSSTTSAHRLQHDSMHANSLVAAQSAADTDDAVRQLEAAIARSRSARPSQHRRHVDAPFDHPHDPEPSVPSIGQSSMVPSPPLPPPRSSPRALRPLTASLPAITLPRFLRSSSLSSSSSTASSSHRRPRQMSTPSASPPHSPLPPSQPSARPLRAFHGRPFHLDDPSVSASTSTTANVNVSSDPYAAVAAVEENSNSTRRASPPAPAIEVISIQPNDRRIRSMRTMTLGFNHEFPPYP